MSKIIKCIAAFGIGFSVGAAIAWLLNALAVLLNALAVLLAGLIGKTATICLLWAISFAIGFFGVRAYINKRSAKPVLLLTK